VEIGDPDVATPLHRLEVPDMHRNGRVIKLSELKTPNLYSLPARESGYRPTIVCPDCRTHREVVRTLIHAHRAEDGVTRCSGSGTRIVFDVTADEWALMLRDATHATDRRRSNRVKIKPEPAVPVPVFRIAAAR
jgi:hypothetical protein